MRFDLEALRQFLSANVSSSFGPVAAAGSAALALLTVAYIAWPGSQEVPADAVVVTGPVFTPVAMTPTAPAPIPAARPTAPSEPALSETRFNDELNVTRAVQRQLKRAGCYDGPVNGIWNAQTRRGMGTFTDRVNARLPVDRADPVLLVLLETHNTTTCAAGAPVKADERRAEVASIEDRRPDERRETRVTDVAEETSEPASPRAEDLGYSAEAQRAPNPMASMQTASTERNAETAGFGAGETAALAAAGTAAAGAAVTPRERASPPERRRTARKYKKQPNLAKSVSKGFKSLQRSLNKLF